MHTARLPRPIRSWAAFSLSSALLVGLATTPARAGFLASDLNALGSRRTAAILTGTAALGFASVQVENPQAQERALDRPLFDAPADFGNIYGGGPVLAGAALGLAGAGLWEKNPDWTRAGSELARSLVYTGVVVNAVKVTVRRTRPNGGAYSFPSGHTAAAFCVAPVLTRRFGWVAALPAYALAVSTGAGRMEDRKHYLSDVVVGAGIGTAIGLAISSRRDMEARHDADPRNVDAVRRPTLGLGVAPSGLSITAQF